MPRRSTFDVGDLFVVPLGDLAEDVAPVGDALGQVVAIEPQALNSVACAFWPSIGDDAVKTAEDRPIAVELVTPDLLRSKRWRVLRNAPVSVQQELRRYEAYRTQHWVGATVRGSGIVRRFLRAYHALEPWDGFHDPDYFTKLLVPGVEIPREAVFKVRV